MYMPLDIVNKKFKKGFMGYLCEDVDRFMEEIVQDYEKLYKENIELKDKITILNEGIQHYKSMEHTLQNTLLIAQKTSEDIKNTAFQRSEVIKKEAEVESDDIKASARREVEKMKQEFEMIKKEYETFRMKFRALLSSELQILENPIAVEKIESNILHMDESVSSGKSNTEVVEDWPEKPLVS